MTIIKINPIFNKNLETAVSKSRSGDTISFTSKQKVACTVVVRNNLTFDGCGKGRIVMADNIVNFQLEGCKSIVFRNLEIVLSKNANFLSSVGDAEVAFENVVFLLPKKIDSRDVYPIIYKKDEELVSLILKNVESDVWLSVSSNIYIENSRIGSLYKSESLMSSLNFEIYNSEITNAKFVSFYSDSNAEIKTKDLKTKGKLSMFRLGGSLVDFSFEGSDLSSKLFENEALVVTRLCALTVSDCENTLFIEGIEVGELAKEMGNSNLFTFESSDVEIRNSDIPSLNSKIVAYESKINLNEVTGDLDWVLNNTSIKSRASKTQGKKAIDKLDELVGLKNAKEQIKKFLSIVLMNKKRKESGLDELKGMSNHMIFAGSAGTGKTTVAKIYGEALYQEGILKSDTFVQATRKDLVGRYVGETALKTNALVQKARGGVLFIDEAYSLKSESENDFAPEAVSELIACMEEYRDELVVILAGYTKDMEDFIYNDNEGLPSRFNSWVYFDDYDEEDLNKILRYQLSSQNYNISSESTDKALSKYMRDLIRLLGDPQGHINGNGRFVRNFSQAIMTAQALRLSTEDGDFTEIKPSDVFEGAKVVLSNSKTITM